MIRVDDFGRGEEGREGGGAALAVYMAGGDVFSWVENLLPRYLLDQGICHIFFLGLKKYIIQTSLAFTQWIAKWWKYAVIV